MAVLRLGRLDEAADWAVQAAARPNAHAHIRAIAAYALALAGRIGEANDQLVSLRSVDPRYGVDDLMAAFRFEPEMEALTALGRQAPRSAMTRSPRNATSPLDRVIGGLVATDYLAASYSRGTLRSDYHRRWRA